MTRYLAAAFLAFFVVFGARAADADPQETRSLHALFDRNWEDISQRFPEGSTYRGDLRYNDRLSDESAEAIAAYDAQVRQWLAEAKAIRPERLDPADRVSLQLFIGNMERRVALQPFAGYRSLRLGALGGAQSDFAELMQVVPMGNREQAQQLLRRMAAYPKLMDQQIAILRRGTALGWVSSRDVLDRVLAQIDEQLAVDVQAGPYFAPFKRLGSDIPPEQRAALQTAGQEAVARYVLPSLKKLRAFVAGEYIPRAPANGALSNYPDGTQVYDIVVRNQTTTNLSAAEIHDIGLRELSRLRGEMEAVMRETKFDGDFAQFIGYLGTDARSSSTPVPRRC